MWNYQTSLYNPMVGGEKGKLLQMVLIFDFLVFSGTIFIPAGIGRSD